MPSSQCGNEESSIHGEGTAAFPPWEPAAEQQRGKLPDSAMAVVPWSAAAAVARDPPVAVVPGQGYYPGSYEYKYSLPKWHQVMNTQYFNASSMKAQSERHRAESHWLTSKLVEQIDRNQADSGQKLRERYQDVHYWKMELQRTIEDVTNELESWGDDQQRLERSIRTQEICGQICLDCMHSRDRREMPDRVMDSVDDALYKELSLIKSVQELFRKTGHEIADQMKKVRDLKETCEMDWANKWEACNIEAVNCKLKNTSNGIMSRHGAPIPVPNMISLEEWCDFSRNAINCAERERAASLRLRGVVEGILADGARDLRDQADAVDIALDERIGETEAALQQLEHHRDRILDEVSLTEKMITEIKGSVEQLEAPLKVNQVRLDNRKYRSGLELCRDMAHTKLLDEHGDLADGIETFLRRLSNAREILSRLEQSRLDLEKDISVKHKTLFIDRNKCKFVRSKYPSFSKLMGFQ